MSEKYELLGRYDIKEPQLLKLSIRSHVNDSYNRLLLLRGCLQENLDFEELFGEYFEQFSDECSDFVAVIGFLHEIGMMSDVIHNAVLSQTETLQNEIISFYKLVYVVPDDEEEENENE